MKARVATATRNQRVEKMSEKEERERQRIETANRRKGRADRRRADGKGLSIHLEASSAHTHPDSDPSDEVPLAARAATNKTTQVSGALTAVTVVAAEVVRPPATADPPPTSNPVPDTPPTLSLQAKAADKKRSHKKKGRNQYTRDRDAHDDESPARSQSRDIQKDEHGAPSSGKAGGGEGAGKAHPKARGGMSSKITMNDMKRRATALLDFISRTQVDLAGESIAEATAETAASSTDGSSVAASDKQQQQQQQNGVGDPSAAPVLGPGKEFKDLGCMEMMDSLTRRLVKWQQHYSV